MTVRRCGSLARSVTMAATAAATAAGLAAMLWLGAAAVAAEDRHAGYYYPLPQTLETYQARATMIVGADRRLRIGFVTGLTNRFLRQPFAPTFAIFAKGEDAEKLIIVGLQDGPLDTLYRARAVLANMTAMARLMPVFQESGAEAFLTFFDLARMLGFTQITVTNGRNFAHRVVLQ